VQALFGAPPGGVVADPLEVVFDRLADAVDAAFTPGALMRLLQPAG